MTPHSNFYRVEPELCDACQCSNCRQWTIVYDSLRDGTIAIGTSWEGDEGRETAEEICDLMNMAFDAGREATDG